MRMRIRMLVHRGALVVMLLLRRLRLVPGLNRRLVSGRAHIVLVLQLVRVRV